MVERRVGRPVIAVLDRARIGQTALAIVDERGDFTLPELARRLGVQTASLYHHVDGRAGVIEEMRAQLAELTDLTALDLRPWDLALRTFVRTYRDLLVAHARVLPLFSSVTIRAPQAIAAYERVIGLLVEAGVAAEDLLTVVVAIDHFIVGSALDVAPPAVPWEVSPGIHAPGLTAALESQDPMRSLADRAFDFGVEALLVAVRGGR